jgi:acetylcholinesterase
VTHGAELKYVYGGLADGTPPSMNLSISMIDYWVSFATSLDPNDGHGSESESSSEYSMLFVNAIEWLGVTWPQYTPDNEVVVHVVL